MLSKSRRNWKILFCVLFFYTSAAPAVPEEKPIIAVYPAWKHTGSTIKDLPWAQFSHLALSGVYPTDDGLLTKGAAPFIKELVLSCHNNNKKIILSIGGAGTSSKGFLKITKDPIKLQRFVDSTTEYVQKNNLDGIDIDWEYWTYQNELNKGGRDPDESGRLLNLIATLRSALPAATLLTVDIAPGAWVGDQYRVDLQKHVDYVNLMAFDFTGAWGSSKIAYHSNFSMLKKAVNYALDKGFNSEKLIV